MSLKNPRWWVQPEKMAEWAKSKRPWRVKFRAFDTAKERQIAYSVLAEQGEILLLPIARTGKSWTLEEERKWVLFAMVRVGQEIPEKLTQAEVEFVDQARSHFAEKRKNAE